MPSQMKEFDSLLSGVRTFLEENTPQGSIPPEKMNKYQLQRAAKVESKQKELEFPESLRIDDIK